VFRTVVPPVEEQPILFLCCASLRGRETPFDQRQEFSILHRPQSKPVKRALVLSGGAARGAFQAGVLAFLERHHWQPDMVCGSSIGAIHAAAIGTGMSAGRLERMWRSAAMRRLESFHLAGMLRRIFSPTAPFSISDAESVRKILETEIDFTRLPNAGTAVRIAAVDLALAAVVYFANPEITVDHVMASAAAPVFYPWRKAAGRFFFDGGLMANTPILPALESGAEEIVVVLLSPVGAKRPLQLRKSFFGVLETAFELMLAGPLQGVLDGYRAGGGALPKIHVIAPPRMLGFLSLGNYTPRQVDRLIEEGYRSAERVLSPPAAGRLGSQEAGRLRSEKADKAPE
jgi:NTE family protein